MATVQSLFERYAKTRGDMPHANREPTKDQLWALKQLADSDSVPYADFSVWGPHSRSRARLTSRRSTCWHRWLRLTKAGRASAEFEKSSTDWTSAYARDSVMRGSSEPDSRSRGSFKMVAASQPRTWKLDAQVVS